VGDFNTPFSAIDRSSRPKINKEILEQIDTIDLMEVTGIYRVFYPEIAQYTFFSAAHGTFSKIDHTRRHKASLNKYKKIEIIPCILSDRNAIKLELHNQSSSRKYSNNWRLNNTLLTDLWVIEEIREEIKRFLKFNENENTTYQYLWDRAKAVLRRMFITMSAYIKNAERSEINNQVLHLKLLEKQEQAKSKTSRRREIMT
jgi:hypothetical protein